MTYDRCRGARYALSALTHKRGSIASEIVECERKLRHLRESLVHVDAALLILDPNAAPETIKNKRPSRRVTLFRQGELGRMIMDALRQAKGETLSTYEIVSALLAAGGHGDDARKAVAGRVRGNLAYLKRQGKVSKAQDGKEARWSIR